MNKFEVSGMIENIKEFKTNTGSKRAGIILSSKNNKVVDNFPIYFFGKSAEVVLKRFNIGDEVNVVAQLQMSAKEGEQKRVQIVGYYVELEGQQEVNNQEQQEAKEQVVKVNGKIKQLSQIDYKVIAVFDSVKEAAKAIKVKKSVLSKALNTEQVVGGYLWTE